MKRLSIPVFFCVFALLLAWSGSPGFAVKPGFDEELADIREEISLLNLLRGLYLTTDQIDRLSALAKKAKNLRDGARAEFDAKRSEIISSFSELRDSLFLAPGQEKVQQDRASNLDKRFKDTTGGIQDAVAAMEDEAAQVLTSAQLAIVSDFKPCLIPPKDLRNPVRVGQAAGDAGKLGVVADLIHRCPEDMWATRGFRLLDTLVTRFQEESGAMTPAMQEDLRSRLKAIAKKIRGLKKVDYALQRPQISEELLVINPQKALKHGHRKTGKIAQFLLSDAAERVLPRWKAASAAQPAHEPIDLEETDGPGDRDNLREKGEKALKQLTRLHKERRGKAGLPDQARFLAPVQQALNRGLLPEIVRELVKAGDQLTMAGGSPALAKAWQVIIRLINRASGLPLLHKEHDPFGFAAEFSTLQQEKNPDTSCQRLQGLAQSLLKFVE